MRERKQTLVISFTEQDIPRPEPYLLHEWIYEDLRLMEEQLEMIQVNGVTRQVFIKCTSTNIVEEILERTKGELSFTFSNGQRTKVKIEKAGPGITSVKIYNLPPELSNTNISTVLEKYGTVYSVTDDSRRQAFRYKIKNGVRTVKMGLKTHIPSYIDVCGFKALVSYENQPTTCSYCHQTGHLRNNCPNKKDFANMFSRNKSDQPAWSNLVAGMLPARRSELQMDVNNHDPAEREHNTRISQQLEVDVSKSNISNNTTDTKSTASTSSVNKEDVSEVMDLSVNSSTITTETTSDKIPEDGTPPHLNTASAQNNLSMHDVNIKVSTQTASQQNTKESMPVDRVNDLPISAVNQEHGTDDSYDAMFPDTLMESETTDLIIRPYLKTQVNSKDPRLAKKKQTVTSKVEGISLKKLLAWLSRLRRLPARLKLRSGAVWQYPIEEVVGGRWGARICGGRLSSPSMLPTTPFLALGCQLRRI
ncbi:hypothetical protein ANN_13153 [Periplaneta americana]|uniref:CCHC-type domain-containing protein n=1 Tax=Periplaneta americana TaxID=6978 RepID=A0ABQ8TJ11_PERAM|nr:hypothetical protein ANN_13153 [Periplaneta americana]